VPGSIVRWTLPLDQVKWGVGCKLSHSAGKAEVFQVPPMGSLMSSGRWPGCTMGFPACRLLETSTHLCTSTCLSSLTSVSVLLNHITNNSALWYTLGKFSSTSSQPG
jgi:hypothetical protein